MEILAFQTGQTLIIILLALLLVSAVLLLVRLRTPRLQTLNRYLKNSHIADAIVLLSEEQPGSYLHGNTFYKLQVHVKPMRGRNFVTEINVLREDLKSVPQSGDKVSVRYSYTGRKRMVVLNLDNH
nr:hypothetical protein [uncultured Dyadobacter sp.]